VEYVIVFSSILVIFIFLLDLVYGKSNALSIVFFANPYIAGLLLYFTIFQKSVSNLGATFKVSISYLILFFLIIALVISEYFVVSVSVRTTVQLLQFIMIISVIFFIILPNNASFQNVVSIIHSLHISILLLCFAKVVSYAMGYKEFSRFGQNEDAFIIVIIGMFANFLVFNRISLLSVSSLFFMVFSIYLYESRAALAIAVLSVLLILTVSFFKYSFLKSFFVGMVLFTFILFMFFNFFSGQLYLLELFDVSRNHSNIERASMHIFTYNYLLSGQDIYGLGNLNNAMEDMQKTGLIEGVYPHPHSTYLRFSLELGWAGLIGIITFYSVLVYKFKRLYGFNKRLAWVYLLLVFDLIVFSFVECIYFSFFRASCVLISISLVLAFTNLSSKHPISRRAYQFQPIEA